MSDFIVRAFPTEPFSPDGKSHRFALMSKVEAASKLEAAGKATQHHNMGGFMCHHPCEWTLMCSEIEENSEAYARTGEEERFLFSVSEDGDIYLEEYTSGEWETHRRRHKDKTFQWV